MGKSKSHGWERGCVRAEWVVCRRPFPLPFHLPKLYGQLSNTTVVGWQKRDVWIRRRIVGHRKHFAPKNIFCVLSVEIYRVLGAVAHRPPFPLTVTTLYVRSRSPSRSANCLKQEIINWKGYHYVVLPFCPPIADFPRHFASNSGTGGGKGTDTVTKTMQTELDAGIVNCHMPLH